MASEKISNGNTTVVIKTEHSARRDFVLSLPEQFGSGKGEVIHAGRNEIRLFVMPDGATFVVKRFRRPLIVSRIAYTFFCKSKARRAFEYAGTLRHRGIDTPREVAYIEVRRGGLFADGYFVSMHSSGKPAFAELVERDNFSHEMATAVASLVVTMHSRGVLHGDLNLGNILWSRTDDGRLHLSVVDTNRSQFRNGWPTRDECLHNMRRITHRRDLFAFIVSRYAEMRQWDAGATLAEATRRLDEFEESRRLKRSLKNRKR